MVGVNGAGSHAGENQHATYLLADGGEHFHFAAGVGVRGAVLHVDYADDLVAGDDRNGEKCLVGVFLQFAEVLETRVLISFAGDEKQAALAGYPARETFIEAEAELANGGRVGVLEAQRTSSSWSMR